MKQIVFITLFLALAVPCAGQEDPFAILPLMPSDKKECGQWLKVIGEDLTVDSYAGRILQFWCPNELGYPDSIWVLNPNYKIDTVYMYSVRDTRKREMTSEEKLDLLLEKLFALQADINLIKTRLRYKTED